MIFTFIFLKVEPSRTKQYTAREIFLRTDWFGSLTLVLAVGSFVLATTLQTSGENLPFKNGISGLYLCSGICVIAFVLVEGFIAEEPVMPLRLLTRRTPAAVAINNL
jgi:hypothetical protein